MNLQQLNKELQIQQALKVHRISLTGLTIRITLILKNPTPGRVTVKTPNLTLSCNGEVLGTSDSVSGKNHVVPPYGQVQLEPIDITLGFINLALNARTFWKQWNDTGRAQITVRAITRINDVVPVEDVKVFDIGKSGDATPALGALEPLAPWARKGLPTGNVAPPKRRRVRRTP